MVRGTPDRRGGRGGCRGNGAAIGSSLVRRAQEEGYQLGEQLQADHLTASYQLGSLPSKDPHQYNTVQSRITAHRADSHSVACCVVQSLELASIIPMPPCRTQESSCQGVLASPLDDPVSETQSKFGGGNGLICSKRITLVIVSSHIDSYNLAYPCI